MKQSGVLATAFVVTLGVLLVALFALRQLGAGETATVSPSPSASDVALATASESASASIAGPSASVEASVEPTSTPSLTTSTSRPTPTRARSASANTIEVVVLGSKYINPSLASNGKVTKLANGGMIMSSDRTISDPSEVQYRIPAGQIPAGTRITRIDVAVCGLGQGDFWESYGPSGSDPDEYEVTKPAADGCWHFNGGTGKDSLVRVAVEKLSSLRIDEVVYTVTKA